VGRWLGGASAGQVQRFLTEGSRAAALLRADARSADDPLHQLASADRLATSGQHDAAAAAYAKALTLAPPDWPRRPETLVAQITALSKAKAYDECLALGSQGMEQTGMSASAVDFAHYALDCAERQKSPLSLATQKQAERRLDVLCGEGSPELSPDDRADACSALFDVRTGLGERAGAHQALLTRLTVLERAALGKPTNVALAYDWARTDALIALDRAAEALPFLLEHERAAPDNYNPPQQQARCYKALGRWAEGLAAIERALALAYGPRRASFLTLKADLLLGAGRNAEARAVVEEQLLAYRALPAGQRQPAAEERVSQRLANWNGASVR
jgi:tetratricopeptide (TPR) repeat protein